MADTEQSDIVDLLIVGGGVNGCGIARDAAGRGLRVVLAEMGDLAGATSSSSTKLFHGGLRYLEFFKFRLVRESLQEREVLLRAMPHISWPMRFVLPLHPDMRFPTDTPAARALGWVMPWLKGRRPAWVIRLALALYDSLGGREILPAARGLDLRRDPAGAVLRSGMTRGFEYSDVWVDDARLVVLNARDAAARGARILTRTKLVSARAQDGIWDAELEDVTTGSRTCVRARALVNAAGPWAGEVAGGVLGGTAKKSVALVRGSHIVTRRLFDHDRAYFLQGEDGRIIFLIPYEQDFTLIGTTDIPHDDPDTPPVCTAEERAYLCGFASRYLRRPVTEADIVWSYSGVRPLFDDGASSATSATRDYVLRLERAPAPVLHVIGGKITTYRRLAEAAMVRLVSVFPEAGGGWTAEAALPGGALSVDEAGLLPDRLLATYPFLTMVWAQRLVRSYGTEAWAVLGEATVAADLGRDFGGTLTEAELHWMRRHEFARTAEDALWRRSKLGLRLAPDRVRAVEDWFAAQ